tara:strand:- start:25240 stop:25836 length:597 start_codon:yes stop_codon:yes gene_type:complete
MILPIVAYGHPVLRKKANDIEKDYDGLDKLIANMFETMYEAEGVGLAAPQIGKSIRLFVIDATPFAEAGEDDDESEVDPTLKDFKKVFINAEIIEEDGEPWAMKEGCLSIPDIREDVVREANILMRWYDENWVEHEERFEGFAARVIQHEYDHIEGILFTDKINPLRRNLLKGKLNGISKGKVSAHYKMKFFTKKGKR